MTQQKISKLLDILRRILRDWKGSKNKLYTFIGNTDHFEKRV